MRVRELGDPIATRTLTMGLEKIVVMIGQPRPSEDGEDYYCSYTIEGAGQSKKGYAIGVDAVQALQLALRKIDADLIHLAEHFGVPITWLEDAPGITGFSKI
jgi:hypothetical protein